MGDPLRGRLVHARIAADFCSHRAMVRGVVGKGVSMRRIGIIGGGQLAWMMAEGAKALNLELMVQTPHQGDPAVAIAAQTILAPITDVVATQKLAQYCDAISFENEFVDLEALAALAERGALFRPRLAALAPLVDKYTQRQCLAAAGLPNPPFVILSPGQDLAQVKADATCLGWPLVMKTRRLGYDGQGTFVVKSWQQLQATWDRINCPEVLIEALLLQPKAERNIFNLAGFEFGDIQTDEFDLRVEVRPDGVLRLGRFLQDVLLDFLPLLLGQDSRRLFEFLTPQECQGADHTYQRGDEGVLHEFHPMGKGFKWDRKADTLNHFAGLCTTVDPTCWRDGPPSRPPPSEVPHGTEASFVVRLPPCPPSR